MTDVEICKEIRERILREWTSEARVILDRDIRLCEAKEFLLIGKLLRKADKALEIAEEIEQEDELVEEARKAGKLGHHHKDHMMGGGKGHMEGSFTGTASGTVKTPL